MQTPTGAIVHSVHCKRLLLALNLIFLVIGALLLMGPLSVLSVYSAQTLIVDAGPLLGPTVAAMTLGLAGAKAFDQQFGRR